MHCVQACLKMLFHFYGRPVLSFKELDIITGHDPHSFTWMGKAFLWLVKNGFEVISVENFDYRIFAKQGIKYLKQVWSEETFKVQDQYSNLVAEQVMARKLINSEVQFINARWPLAKIHSFRIKGDYFTLLSVNQFALYRKDGYGAHMVVLGEKKGDRFKVYDPDRSRPQWIPSKRLAYSMSPKRKEDFNVIFMRRPP